MNTKTIARRTGQTTASVNAIIRDLRIEHWYIAENRSWYVSERDGLDLIAMIAEAN